MQRAPRAPELFSRGPHEATGTFDIGNPDLGIETAQTVEAALRRSVGPFRFEASLFQTRFEGFIYRNLTGETCEGSLFWRDSDWLARVNLLHAFAQNNTAQAGETPTAGYNLLKAEVSYRKIFGPGDPLGKEMTIGLAGNNLLNQDIRNSVSYRKNEVLLPGASLRIFATLRF